MPAGFGVSRAKSLLEAIEYYMSVIDKAVELKNNMIRKTGELRREKVLELLEKVPSEELRNEKRGVRVKLLQDNGYGSIADILRSSPAELESINGIGPEGAHIIYRMARSYYELAEPRTHIRLSADERTPETTGLIRAISEYRSVYALVGDLPDKAALHRDKIINAQSDLNAVCGLFSRFFAAGEKKRRAAEAFDYLSLLMDTAENDGTLELLERCAGLTTPNDDEAWRDFSLNSISFITTIESLCPDAFENGRSENGLPAELLEQVLDQRLLLDGLKCTLRRYQVLGVQYILNRKRALLGDEMGLGKTVEALAAMTSLYNSGETHFLIVCPASVVTNWCREISSKTPLTVSVLHGANRRQTFDSWLRSGGAAVTSYESTSTLLLPEDFRLGMLTVDEAHYIKNYSSLRSLNTRRLCRSAENVLFMTGTPLENSVSEMVSLIRVLDPDVAKSVEGLSFMSAAPKFRELVSPVYFRRRREDVLTELPEKTESPEWCTLQTDERRVYEAAVLDKRYSDARRVSWNAPDIRSSSKALRLLQLVADAKNDSRKVIVFSYFLDTLKRVTELLGPCCMPAITGALSPEQRQAVIDEFTAAPEGAVLPAQIVSGGTGLNIQAASVIILCEPQFKPSIENQAISRAYRMGQSRSVLVYRLLCEDTVDERILELLENKQTVFDEFADVSQLGSEALSVDEKSFAVIMEEEREHILASLEALPDPGTAEAPADADGSIPSPDEVDELLKLLSRDFVPKKGLSL